MIAFLYAGQGSQFVGMGRDLYEKYPDYRKIADEADTGFDHIRLMHEGPDTQLMQTEYTQGCMAVFACGVTKLLQNRGITPDAAAGLSLGEYGALYAAGVWDAADYIRIVSFRGRAMAEAAAGKEVLMSAVTGLSAEETEAICRRAGEQGFAGISNYNCPGQYVICGENAAVEEAERLVGEAGGKCIRLKTSGPFHTPLLSRSGDALKAYLEAGTHREPSIPVAMNVTGRLLQDGEDLITLLEKQVQSPVRFEDDLRSLIELGADDFIEIGPGKVLSGLLRKTARSMKAQVRVRSISSAEDLESL